MAGRERSLGIRLGVAGTTGTASALTGWAHSTSRANLDPSDRYVQSLPGSGRYRLAPGGTGLDNLVVAGDWTACGFDAGSMEAATRSVSSQRAVLSGSEGWPLAGTRVTAGMAPGERDTSSARSSVRAAVCGLGGGPIRRDHQSRAVGDPPTCPRGARRDHSGVRVVLPDARGRLRLSTGPRLIRMPSLPALRPSSCPDGAGTGLRGVGVDPQPHVLAGRLRRAPCHHPHLRGGVQHSRRCGHVPARVSGPRRAGHLPEVTVRVSVPEGQPVGLYHGLLVGSGAPDGAISSLAVEGRGEGRRDRPGAASSNSSTTTTGSRVGQRCHICGAAACRRTSASRPPTTCNGLGRGCVPRSAWPRARRSGVSSRTPSPPAAAIELFHTAFLVHDDVEDDSELRRGRRRSTADTVERSP